MEVSTTSDTSDPWYQMWIRSPKDTDPVSLIKRCEPFLDRMTCLVETSLRTGVIIRSDGTIGIRGYNEHGFRYAKKYLEEQGFIIEDERVVT